MRTTSTILLSVLGLSCFYTTAVVAQSSTEDEAQVPLPESVRLAIEAQNRLLIDLAIERYTEISDRGETWILRSHRGSDVKKWKDDRYTLVSIPAPRPEDVNVVKGYCHTYNFCNLDRADKLAQAGNYSDARRIYQLVLRLGVLGDIRRAKAEEQLLLLDELVQGNDLESNLRRLKQLHEAYSTFTELPDIEKASAVQVSNLMETIPTDAAQSTDE